MKQRLLDDQNYQYPADNQQKQYSINRDNPNIEISISRQQKKYNDQHMTEAYEDFKERLCFDYLLTSDIRDIKVLKEKLNMVKGNTSAESLATLKCAAYGLFCLVCPTVMYCTSTIFEVNSNHFALVEEQSKGGRCTKIYGPGFHRIGYFNRVQGIYSFDQNYPNGIIESDIGDLKICKVVQGSIMHLDCGGNNIILGPGIHLITDPMVFIKNVNLNSFYIEIGPEKWITVPQGYDGISLNRGKLKILEGGKQHHLAHIGDKFAKMVPKNLQTDRVPSDIPAYLAKKAQDKVLKDSKDLDPSHYLETTSIEGASVHLDCMIFWKIIDTELAANTAMAFLQIDDGKQAEQYFGQKNQFSTGQQNAIQAASEDITDLRSNVLRICKNHLCTLVGSCSVASKTSLALAVKKKDLKKALKNQKDEDDEEFFQKDDKSANQQAPKQNQQASIISNDEQQQQTFQILAYLQDQCVSLKDHINEDIQKIGVILDNICIFSVIPSKDIQKELDKQTKAKVDANTAILQARAQLQSSAILQESESRNKQQKELIEAEILQIKARSERDAEITRAEGQQKAIIMVAQARKKEAEELQSIKIAQDLAQIRELGLAGEKIFTGGSNNFVFGSNPGDVIYSMLKGIKNEDKKE